MAINDKIGGAYYELVMVDNMTVTLKRVEGQVKASTAGMARDTRAYATAVKKTSDEVEAGVLQQVGAFRRLFGQVAGGIATFASFVAIGERIGRMLISNAEDTEAWLKVLQSGSIEDRLKGIGKELEKLQNANDGGPRGFVEGLFQGMSPAQVREKIAALEQERAALEVLRNRQQANKEEKERLETMRKQTQELQRQLNLSHQIAQTLRGSTGPESVVFGFERMERAITQLANRIGRGG